MTGWKGFVTFPMDNMGNVEVTVDSIRCVLLVARKNKPNQLGR